MAVVKAGMVATFVKNTNIVSEIRIAFGGMSNTVKMAEKTMSALKGQ